MPKGIRIGIITHYYKTSNYGGILQAYALCRALNEAGYEAEQICFADNKMEKKYEDDLIYILIKNCLYMPVLLKNVILNHINRSSVDHARESKVNAFMEFAADMIPHSGKVYTYSDIDEAGELYDMYISGSDQVWNGYNYGYTLDFVKRGKKIAYSASVSRDRLNKRLRRKLQESLSTYSAISVREMNDKRLLQQLTDTDIVVTADPVFLLEKEDWEKMAAEPLVEGKYIFCYFLGHNLKARSLAKELSNKYGYKLVMIPMFRDGMYKEDLKLGAVLNATASPEEFLSYIKHAEIVLTDSFHAVAFSMILEKSFFVFNRDIRKYMTSRIENIVKITNTGNRYCDCWKKESLKHILQADDIDYARVKECIKHMKIKSIKYLIDSVKRNEQ